MGSEQINREVSAAVRTRANMGVVDVALELRGGRPFDSCPYPLHRLTDWEGDGGRLVCGVCHPPARQPSEQPVS